MLRRVGFAERVLPFLFRESVLPVREISVFYLFESFYVCDIYADHMPAL